MRMKPCKNNPWPARTTMSGFSLIEIMVALGISLFIIAGIGYVYISSKQTYRTQDQLARLQENGRLAFEYLSRDIRMAGYWGCGTGGMDSDVQYTSCPTAPKGKITNTLNSASTIPFNLSRYTEGFNDVTSSFTTYPNVKTGTDVIIVRGADSLGLRVTKHVVAGTTPPGAAPVGTNPTSLIAGGDILMVTDCMTAAVFQASGVTSNSTQTTIAHAAGTSPSPGNSIADLCKNYVGGEVLKAFSRGYYIGTLDGSNQPTSTGRPALFRANFSNYQELVPGVENMQITYGVDTNNDYFVDAYQRADEVTQWAQVKNVRIELLLASPEDNITAANTKYRFPTSATSDTTAGDRRLYYVTSTTISIRNRIQ
jgi:type IV pilus assembly protein PilW